MIMRRRALVLSVVASLGCSLDTNTPISRTPPRVRFVNAASASTNVAVHLNQSGVAITSDSLAFREFTESCTLIVPTTHQITFVQNGVTLASVTAAYELDRAYLVALVSSGTTFRAVALAEADSVAAGSNGLRLINATATAGDVYVTAAADAPTAATKVAGDLGPVAATNATPPYVVRPATDLRVRLFSVGGTTTDRANLTLAPLGPERVTTVLFTDRGNPAEPGALQLNACP